VNRGDEAAADRAQAEFYRKWGRAAQAAAQDSARIKSGLPQQQYFVMAERIERWHAIAVKNERGPKFWTDEENALFEARRERIERVFARRG
jgi:hypothetical protein